MSEEHDLGGRLLAEVSRSFYLTLKALPEEVREPLSVAYLLARAADTVADTEAMPGEVRLEGLREFEQVVQRGAPEAGLMGLLQGDFMPRQTDEAERRLLERLAELLAVYRGMPEVEAGMMRGVLEPIVRGQMLDIQRFPQDGKLRALGTAEELEGYTWLVAGCVGEFWTRLCAAKLEGWKNEEVSVDEMIRLGVAYGKGLQLVNILRDVAKDSRLGRCYLPQEELAAGLSLNEVQGNPALLTGVAGRWTRRCRVFLEEGVEYVNALEMKRLRYATALPLLLGFRTLALLEEASPEAWLAGVKVPRGETTKLLFEAGMAAVSRQAMMKLMRRCAGG